MIQTESLLRVNDNSGAKRVKCIKVLGGFKKTYASTGNLIVVSIKRVKQHKKKKIKIKEGDVVYALILRAKSKSFRLNSFSLEFSENSVVLLTNKKKPISTRILGFVPKELRYSKFMKVVFLSSGFI